MVKLAGQVSDEIDQFENMRCIGALEACARIFSLAQSERYPSVQQLTVHLPKQQLVLFHEGKEETIVADESKCKTELTEFFSFNKNNPGTVVKYCDFPEYFAWNKIEKCWSKRKLNKGAIGRVYTVHPFAGDRYYLRMLLHHNFCKGKHSVFSFFKRNFYVKCFRKNFVRSPFTSWSIENGLL